MTRRGFDRRFFLKGLGAGTALASGFFSSKVAMGQTDAAPVRLLLVPLQHGWGRDRDYGVFTGSETDFTIPAPLSGFDAIKDQCVFVDGLRGTLWGNAHDVSYSDIFTAAVPWGEGSSAQLGAHFPEPMGPSIDWLVANTLGVNALRVTAGFRSWGRPYNPTCFDGNNQELGSYTSARRAFDAIIDPLNDSANSDMDRGRRAVRDRLFTYLGRDTERMMAKVSGTERLKLESYLTAMNDLSGRFSGGAMGGLDPADIPPRPGDNQAIEQEIDNYFELIRIAFLADTHRVAVLGLGEQYRDFDWVDSMGTARVGNIYGSDFHHEIAHYENADMRLAFEGWAAWYVTKMVQFVRSLETTIDVDGRPMIDNTIIVLTGEVETGGHDTRSKVHTVIGGGGGIQRGRWLDLPDVEPRDRQGVFIGGVDRAGTQIESGINYGKTFGRHHHADLWVTIARLCGVPIDTFGLAVNNHEPIALT
ncbi:MAG: DUF1552 domain-containing protein [Deltaproteobacteria bacterium]